MTEKLQKILSRAGIGSRRALEQMIEEGRITVNGKIASIGDRFEANEILVKLDGRVVLSPESNQVSCRVLMYHKPEGELTTLSDPENRPTVFDHIPKPPQGRWIYIGRLDINTSGLLLFTTDGDLANGLMHPKNEVERVYAARIYGEVNEEQIDKLTQGVTLEDGKARFNRVVYVGGEGRNAWYHVTLKEGRKREVRRLWEAVGLKVSRLIRIKYAGVDLDPNLKTGQFRELTLSELNKLRKTVGLEPMDALPPALDLTQSGAKGANKKSPYGKPSVRAKDESSSSDSPSRNGRSAPNSRGSSDNRGRDNRFSKGNENGSRRPTNSRDGFSKSRTPNKSGSSKFSRGSGSSFAKGVGIKSRGTVKGSKAPYGSRGSKR